MSLNESAPPGPYDWDYFNRYNDVEEKKMESLNDEDAVRQTREIHRWMWDRYYRGRNVVDEHDIRAVCEFITKFFPNYEDALEWDWDMKLEDYEWGRAAKRLLEDLGGECCQEGGGMIGWDRALSKDEIETVYERWMDKMASGKTSLEALQEIARENGGRW